VAQRPAPASHPSIGVTIKAPADRTVVQALAANGMESITSCDQGLCRTCLTRVLSGEPDHLDSYLPSKQQEANAQFLA
jgi:vanillate O-demethylase ferredoxin subunit